MRLFQQSRLNSLQWFWNSMIGSQFWVRTPFEDAIWPPLLGSTSQAIRNARAKALKVASTMWCEFLPPSFLMWRVIPPVVANEEKKCSTNWVSNVPIRSVGMSQSKLRCGRPERSCREECFVTAFMWSQSELKSWICQNSLACTPKWKWKLVF